MPLGRVKFAHAGVRSIDYEPGKEAAAVNRPWCGPSHMQANGLPSSSSPDSPYHVSTRVLCCALEFEVVFVRSSDGVQYVLTSRTAGIDITTLHEGEAVECLVSGAPPRVLSAMRKVEAPAEQRYDSGPGERS
jgi:hypothetical protein